MSDFVRLSDCCPTVRLFDDKVGPDIRTLSDSDGPTQSRTAHQHLCWFTARRTTYGVRCTVYGVRCTVYGVRLLRDPIWNLGPTDPGPFFVLFASPLLKLFMCGKCSVIAFGNLTENNYIFCEDVESIEVGCILKVDIHIAILVILHCSYCTVVSLI